MTEEYYKNQFNALRSRADEEAIKEIDRRGSSFAGVRIITVEEYKKYKELEDRVKWLERHSKKQKDIVKNIKKEIKEHINACDYNTSLSCDSIARKAAFMEILQFIKKCTKKEKTE